MYSPMELNSSTSVEYISRVHVMFKTQKKKKVLNHDYTRPIGATKTCRDFVRFTKDFLKFQRQVNRVWTTRFLPEDKMERESQTQSPPLLLKFHSTSET